MAENLKPCPFCGGEALFCDDLLLCWIQCENCDASTVGSASPEHAKAAWNQRATNQDGKSETAMERTDLNEMRALAAHPKGKQS